MTRRALLTAHDRLARRFGAIRFRPGGSPLNQLIETILSQNTSDTNSVRAFRNLRKRFRSWADVVKAPTPSVADAIRSGGLADIKAPRIQQVLRIIREREGRYSLARLRRMSSAGVMDYLTALPGVGAKTAACVLLFSMGRPVMPVDTHVHRVTLRLGWIPPRTRPEDAGPLLERHLPPGKVLSMHLYLVWHGRATCKARRPRCHECALHASCAFFRGHGRGPPTGARPIPGVARRLSWGEVEARRHAGGGRQDGPLSPAV
jgi:endonuclease-3